MSKEERHIHSPWEMLYDFLIEIFATMIPGIFFLSFFVFLALILLPNQILTDINNFAKEMSLFMSLVFGSIAYCFGALFHRKEIKKVDRKSARHIFTKGPHDSGHSFAFANAITENYIRRLVCILQVLAMNEDGTGMVEINGVKTDLAAAVLEKSKEDIRSVLKGHHLTHNIEKNERLWQYAVRRLVYMIYEEPTDKELEKRFEELSNQFSLESSLHLRESLENIIWSRMNEIYCARSQPGDRAKANGLSALLKHVSAMRDGNCYKTAKRLHKKLTEIHDSAEFSSKDRQWKTGIEKVINYLNSDLEPSIDWPYSHMKRYCLDRGLEFAGEVDWGDGAIKGLGMLDEIGLSTHINLPDEIKRSKSRINTQKMWISTQDPVLYHAISQNEAHIRFMNAIRHAATPILVFAIITSVLSLCVILLDCIPSMAQFRAMIPAGIQSMFITEECTRITLALVLSIVYLAICWTIMRSIPEIMHYQRVRELTMILKAQSIISERDKKTAANP